MSMQLYSRWAGKVRINRGKQGILVHLGGGTGGHCGDGAVFRPPFHPIVSSLHSISAQLRQGTHAIQSVVMSERINGAE